MKTIQYYFKLEFQYMNGTWLSNEGNLRSCVSATHDVLKNTYVDYSILGDFIILTLDMQDYSKAKILITRLKQELSQKGNTYYGNEHVGLKIEKSFCRPIDNLGTEDGIDGPLSWNIITPPELQYIPTEEVFNLFNDWLKFLKEVELNAPKFVR
ncbi:MAG TPA: hypothetical protein PK006_13485 [Saprospiraceae bacterium]|nr:hypothetical protein [Saprospiraceae bacterium]